MSQHQAFRRRAVDGQVAQKMEVTTLPAPMRGLVLTENEAFTQPGGAVVLDNWKPTLRGLSLRGGCIRWCELPETTPIISAWGFDSSINHRMFVANATKVYDVTTNTPVLVKSGQTSGNYSTSQMSNASGEYLIALNDAGDAPLLFDGTLWTTLNAGQITGPPGSAVVAGANLVSVCKYRSRWFFIEKNSMNAYYLDINAVGGLLKLIPLSGAAARGGKLLFCAVWSQDAGDGLDDKIVFVTDAGEIIVFTGSNPSDAANWRQEGRFEISPPLGKNAHISVGGDLLVATVDGIVPISGAVTKGRTELELAAITRTIKPMWRTEVLDKREHPWTMMKWDEYGGMFVSLPGGAPGKYRCLAINLATGAWTRYTGWDAMCWISMRADRFFGTQRGVVMQMDRTGYDDGMPYVATLVGGWEMFSSQSQMVTWRQARMTYAARSGDTFFPQISGCVDYAVTIPPPPPVGEGAAPVLLDLWDEGLWDTALWDVGVPLELTRRNTGWVSVGVTGYSHAPVIQITVAQSVRPEFDFLSLNATFERAGITV